MPTNNEHIIRNGYRLAEIKDVLGWVNIFTKDGSFTDESVGVTYRGPKELARALELYAKAFPDLHRELHHVHETGDTVIVELSLQGTHKGPLDLPTGVIPATNTKIDARCCDVFRLSNGRVQSFHCYPSATILGAVLNAD
jgi:ketosteroid isomerase-like protein